MADVARRRPHNVAGDLFVDDTCIDCDTCRWMAPETFGREEGQSMVRAQPGGPDVRRRALHALLSCPTGSIGTEAAAPDLAAAASDFPLPVTDDVSHCGFHSRSSFGAASYLIRHPDGNVLVDSPRFAGPLVKRLESLGGVHAMVLTHRDDVADHARFHERFGCRRIIHEADSMAIPDAEETLTGEAPQEVMPDLWAIPVPGHTRGHVVYLWGDVLFGGDHVCWNPRADRLHAFRQANWYSWPETIRSMARLREHRFTRVLPGHGAPVHLPERRMRAALEDCIAWMKRV